MPLNKISVIGNACSGKTTLSRLLAEKYQLPLTHVDSIQFLPGMKLRDPQETIKILEAVANQDQWIIDGFGPLRIIEDRFRKSDLIIFIRIPLWKTYWWCAKRQVRGLFVRRPELPPGCFESTLPQTLKLIQTIWNVHFKMWPQLDRIFARDEYKDKVIYMHKVHTNIDNMQYTNVK
ncbi:MAG: hypothetical protein BroJett040_24340 [Oligoflexia bacterium]|nr:MAG: hypothetical protein BroJett040_24340 [Oligoflexia bacterium]